MKESEEKPSELCRRTLVGHCIVDIKPTWKLKYLAFWLIAIVGFLLAVGLPYWWPEKW